MKGLLLLQITTGTFKNSTQRPSCDDADNTFTLAGRIIENAFAHERINIVSTPAGTCTAPEEDDGGKGYSSSGPGGRSRIGPLSATVVPEETVAPLGLSSGSGSAEVDTSNTFQATRESSRVHPAVALEWMESTRAPISTISAATPIPHLYCHNLTTGINGTNGGGVVHGGESAGSSTGGRGVVAQLSEKVFVSPGSRNKSFEAMEDNGISAADWLDVTQAMLHTTHASDGAGLV